MRRPIPGRPATTGPFAAVLLAAPKPPRRQGVARQRWPWHPGERPESAQAGSAAPCLRQRCGKWSEWPWTGALATAPPVGRTHPTRGPLSAALPGVVLPVDPGPCPWFAPAGPMRTPDRNRRGAGSRRSGRRVPDDGKSDAYGLLWVLRLTRHLRDNPEAGVRQETKVPFDIDRRIGGRYLQRYLANDNNGRSPCRTHCPSSPDDTGRGLGRLDPAAAGGAGIPWARARPRDGRGAARPDQARRPGP